MQKAYIEKILSLNGLSSDTNNTEIEDFLKQAKWSDEDIKKALKILRETVAAGAVEVSVSTTESLERLGYHSGRYSPEKIQTLLGIKLDVSSLDIEQYTKQKQSIALNQVVLIVVLTIVFASCTLAAVFAYYKIDFLAFMG